MWQLSRGDEKEIDEVGLDIVTKVCETLRFNITETHVHVLVPYKTLNDSVVSTELDTGSKTWKNRRSCGNAKLHGVRKHEKN